MHASPVMTNMPAMLAPHLDSPELASAMRVLVVEDDALQRKMIEVPHDAALSPHTPQTTADHRKRMLACHAHCRGYFIWPTERAVISSTFPSPPQAQRRLTPFGPARPGLTSSCPTTSCPTVRSPLVHVTPLATPCFNRPYFTRLHGHLPVQCSDMSSSPEPAR